MATKLNILDAVSEYRKRLANYLLQYCSKFHHAEEEKKTAQAWQNMSFDEQPDYYDYFSLHGMETF